MYKSILPQMAPMNWLMLALIINLILLGVASKLHFSVNYPTLGPDSKNSASPNKMFSLKI